MTNLVGGHETQSIYLKVIYVIDVDDPQVAPIADHLANGKLPHNPKISWKDEKKDSMVLPISNGTLKTKIWKTPIKVCD